MNEFGSYIRVEYNYSSWSTFVGCQGVAYRALMIGSPRCTWSLQQDHKQTAPLGLTSPGTARHHVEALAGAVSLLIIFAYIHKIIHVFVTVPLLN